MQTRNRIFQLLFTSIIIFSTVAAMGEDKVRTFNGPYSGKYLNRVAFPIGGIGAGMVCLEGTGAVSHVSVKNKMEVFDEPCTFAAICVKGKNKNVAKVLEGPVPGWKIFGNPKTGNGAAGTSYGLPRFTEAEFLARFPFGIVTLKDDEIPMEVQLTGWSPFIPGNADDSSLPVGALEYHFKNRSDKTIDAVFSYNTKSFFGKKVLPMKNGFILSEKENGFAIYTDDNNTVVDHCWFKGGWWDSLTLAWKNIQDGRLMDNPSLKGDCPGASLFVPVKLKPGQEKTIHLMLTWYVPKTNLRSGRDAPVSGPAFGGKPSKGSVANQQKITGFLGKGLVNTFDPLGDDLTGTLTSPEFKITSNNIHFLIGGGNMPGKECVNLLIDGKTIRTATGNGTEKLKWTTWDVKTLKGKTARIIIIDNAKGPWGHINVDQIVMTDDSVSKAAKARPEEILQDFESSSYGDWIAETQAKCKTCCLSSSCCTPVSTYHIPWYAGKFKSIKEVTDYWRNFYKRLRKQSALFRDTFYDTTLPPEVVEAVAANLTILKSPTILRQVDGRLWCFEGCSDDHGCCDGSCTHVWNYAQAIPHLFPNLERSLRKTEFNESQDERGHQTFRSALPIRPVAHTFYAAADGQLGGIMKMYREWRISGDTKWMRKYWPKVKLSLNYCIKTWDPRHKGVLEEPHHNTYDIEYWGPEGHCTSFYLGALTAAIKMGNTAGDDVSLYRELLKKGRRFLETKLFNGEYFYQKIQTRGLNAKFKPLDSSNNGKGYAGTIKILNTQGPKYQYGTGCLSDGVVGFWMARMCGLGEIVDRDKVISNLKSIHKYNLKRDLFDHVNPQRPSFAAGHEGGLLLCTWPHGGALSIPFVYSDEVWTGIEYQVASHLMLEGLVKRGLEIVQLCRARYDGQIRNPFNEYECGHWYARAMSSYGLIQGLTGIQYDAVEKTLYIDSKIGSNFKSFLSTETGFGSIGLKSSKPFVDIKMGKLDIKKVYVSGKETKL